MKNWTVIVSKHCMCLDSRAMGDFSFKQNANLSPEDQIVSGCPDVVCRSVSQDWQFVLLACDGIWDVLSNQVRNIFYSLPPICDCTPRLST